MDEKILKISQDQMFLEIKQQIPNKHQSKKYEERTIENDKMRWTDFQIDNKKIVENKQKIKINRK